MSAIASFVNLESAVFYISGVSCDVIQSTPLAWATEIHSVSMDSPCESSDNKSEESFNLDDVACIRDDDDREPLATEEEAARHNADMEREAEIEEEYRRRCNGEVNKDTWYDI